MVNCDRLLRVLDVCHSGAAGAAEKQLTREARFNVDQVVLDSGQVLVASSDADQSSWESVNYKNGVFTYRLLEGLRKKRCKNVFD
jgi:uncharacterized caspase-like protein